MSLSTSPRAFARADELQANPRSSNRPQERALLDADEALLAREAEVGGAVDVGAQARAIGFVVGKARERHQSVCLIVGALERQPIAHEISTAARNDLQPAPRVGLEVFGLMRFDLVANEDGEAHEGLLRGGCGPEVSERKLCLH